MRIAITGLGLVTPVGAGARAVYAALRRGEVALGPSQRFFRPGLRSDIAGIVDDAGLAAIPGASRAERMAVTAAREALDEAAPPGPLGLVVAGSTGGIAEAELSLARLTAEVAPVDDPIERAALRNHVLTAPTDRVASFDAFAFSLTLCSACSGGSNAVVVGAAALRQGRARAVLCGGVDALGAMTLAGFSALAALDPVPCRPFHRHRAGLSLGEAAAFLVLEPLAAAESRGAHVLAELAGYAARSEAHHITQPARDGVVAASVIAGALERAGLSPRDVDYVNAHGTATPHNDPAEVAALSRVFDPLPPTSSIKGHLGHSLAAAGALEAVVCALAVAEGAPPATAGLDDPDPACAVPPVPEGLTPSVTVSNAFGFGGTDTSLVVTAARRGAPKTRPVGRIAITAAAVLGHAATPVDHPRAPLAPVVVEGLDPMRARRFDRAARLTTAVVERVSPPEPHLDTALVVGSAFGSVTATGTFLRRLYEKGPRFASPAHFPSALPSSLASQASIYLGLTGAALSCADRTTSGEAAAAMALLWLADGLADAVVAAAVEEQSAVAERVSSPLVTGLETRRGEGAAAVRFAPIATAETILCEVAAWGFDPSVPKPSTSQVGASTSRGPGAVFSARALSSVPEAWAGAPHHVVTRRGADHEAAGGAALALAALHIAAREADEVLVLGESGDRRYAFHLVAPTTRTA